MTGNARLEGLTAAELAIPVDPRVTAMAEAVAARHGEASRAVLFYGSCLREEQLDGLMLDFYLIVSDYKAAYDKGWMAKANALIPPNVFPFEHEGLAAKYAVLSEEDFLRENSVRARSVSVWARFAQPTRLVWAADDKARACVVQAVADAPATLFAKTLPLIADTDPDPMSVWDRGFKMTYGAELRAERKGRGSKIIDTDPARYRLFGEAALDAVDRSALPSARAMARQWKALQRKGKWLSVARLAKATTTFAGGIDYIAWKINRHAGTELEVKPWQRRHPIIAAFTLLPRLLRSGAVK
ncbi:hypothetical protein [Sphingomicrobium clamense]|uniref:Phosphatidate cytidylyltransferase n=1 Tax=Sphingomicrobium clamense TaxID=2851013 RepID=A0ABS6V800_9SPHN|nr:hypothetical protein [Sphingomicrobium sp. B8]MBW0145712.1 hypothetical protein [Sphingomicrobium sp. B8]